MPNTENTKRKQGAVIGGWICLTLATAMMVFMTLYTFMLYLPLFFTSFVLGIVAIAQRRIGPGILTVLLSIIIPLTVGIGLGAHRVQQAVDRAESRSSLKSSMTLDQYSDTTEGQSPERRYIEESVDLYDFHTRYVNTHSNGQVPGVDFKIRNKGDRTLERVEVVVFFMDSSGTVVADETFTPVLVTRYSMSGDNKPLKPGYIWQQERGKVYSVNTVPSEWKEGAAVARISEIRFAKGT